MCKDFFKGYKFFEFSKEIAYIYPLIWELIFVTNNWRRCRAYNFQNDFKNQSWKLEFLPGS